MRKVYLDHSATTPVDERIVQAMLPFLTGTFGNASSVHGFGQAARAAVDSARRQVAALIGARANEIVFTSGGTEANNLAIAGLCEAAKSQGHHIITSAIEHPSVQGRIEALEKNGWPVTRLPVFENGIDAVQAIGRVPIDVEALNCDLLSLSGHKIYAPKGIGALYIRRGVRLRPQQVGGHQERERRAGTESVPNIVAFGLAAELAAREMNHRNAVTRQLRDRFEKEVTERIDNIVFNGDRDQRLPHLSNISFRFIEGEGLLIHLDMPGVAVSTGSACSSGTLEPSPVIRALGRTEELARGAIRFSFGKDNSDEDVDYAINALAGAVQALRMISPLHQDNFVTT